MRLLPALLGVAVVPLAYLTLRTGFGTRRTTAILAGLLGTQARLVLAAHRRQGLVLERRIDIGAWTTLVLRR